jgi:photosystem II stability/assembly factor-like uncharacterized protein
MVFALVLSPDSQAPAQWIQQSPIPTGRHLNSVYFVTPTHGFVVGENRHLLETTNGGTTWATRMSDVLGTDPFYRVYFSDAQHGFIAGNGDDSWRTTNGGVTWTQMTSIGGSSWYHLDFITPTSGYAGANGACSFTSDAGTTWTSKSVYPDCPVMYGMDFRDELVGLACGTLSGSDGIFKTTDGGATWQPKSSLITNDVLWWTNNIVFAAGLTSVYRSTDAGESWNIYATGINTGLLKLARIDNTTLAGVSAGGDVWRSTNEGLTWTQVFDGPGDLPASWSIRFVDAQHGWVVGQSGFMYASDDGGMTWRQVNNGVGVQVYDMEFLTDNYGMAVGHNGYVFRTTNGGNWWEVQKLEVTGQIFGRDESLHGISIVDSGFAVVAGPGGTVFRTYNAGVSWEPIGYPALPGLFWIEDVKFTSRNNGWVVGLDQDIGHGKTIYRTTDGGTTWTQPMNQPSYLWAVDFTDENHGWITTIGYLYSRTTNGGATWIDGTYPPFFVSPTVSDIQFANNDIGWAVGWDGFVARSTDGGISWTYQDIGTTDDHLFSIHVVSTNEAWMTGREAGLSMNGVIYHTINGGASWTREVAFPWPFWGNGIAGSPSGHLWTAGYDGRISKRTAPTGIEEHGGTNTPQAFRLHQNYPNPFNPTTTIRYELATAGKVSLKVFDVLGREVATLVNEERSPGSYSARWDAANIGSGTYFYRLESNGRREIKKMLLVR